MKIWKNLKKWVKSGTTRSKVRHNKVKKVYDRMVDEKSGTYMRRGLWNKAEQIIRERGR